MVALFGLYGAYGGTGYQDALWQKERSNQQFYAQQQQSVWTTGTATNDVHFHLGGTTADSAPIQAEPTKAVETAPEVDLPESSLAWLDRRINEMRVAL